MGEGAEKQAGREEEKGSGISEGRSIPTAGRPLSLKAIAVAVTLQNVCIFIHEIVRSAHAAASRPVSAPTRSDSGFPCAAVFRVHSHGTCRFLWQEAGEEEEHRKSKRKPTTIGVGWVGMRRTRGQRFGWRNV